MPTYNSSDLDDRLTEASQALGIKFPRLPEFNQPINRQMWQQQFIIEELIRRHRASAVHFPPEPEMRVTTSLPPASA